MISKEVQELILKEFGMKDGVRIIGVVLPNIEADFRKMIEASLPESLVSEEYKFDDRAGGMTLCGKKRMDGSIEIQTLQIGSKQARW